MVNLSHLKAGDEIRLTTASATAVCRFVMAIGDDLAMVVWPPSDGDGVNVCRWSPFVVKADTVVSPEMPKAVPGALYELPYTRARAFGTASGYLMRSPDDDMVYPFNLEWKRVGQ